MTSFTIDQGIPLPSKARSSKYPFADMSVGDSFFIAESSDQTTFRAKSSVYSAMTKYAKATGTKYTIRSVSENGVNGLRVWRTE